MAQIAHDVGLAAWSGGATMGAVGLNGATREVDDHTQRLRVADAAWFRWAPLLATSIGAHVLGALRLGRLPMRPLASGTPRWLLLRLSLTVAAGDVPVATAVVPVADTPSGVATTRRRLRVAQWLVPALTGAIWIVDAVQTGPRAPRRDR